MFCAGSVVAEQIRVTGTLVNVRAVGDPASEIVGQVARDDLLEATGNRRSGMVEIVPPPGTAAWVYGELIRNGKVVATSLRVRSGPGIGYRSIGKLLKGHSVKVVKTVGDWVKIEPPSVCRVWISGDFVEEHKQADSAAIAEAAPLGEAPVVEPGPTPVAEEKPVVEAVREPVVEPSSPEAESAKHPPEAHKVAAATGNPVPERREEQPVTKVPAAHRGATKKVEHPVVAHQVPRPVVHPAAKRPVVAHQVSRPVVHPAAKRPVVAHQVSRPVVHPAAKRPAVAHQVSRPVVHPVAKRPVVAHQVLRPAVHPVDEAQVDLMADTDAQTLEIARELDLVSGVPQGAKVTVFGRVELVGFLPLHQPSPYRLVITGGYQKKKPSCYLLGDRRLISPYLKRTVRVVGKKYWVRGVKAPAVLVKEISLPRTTHQ